MVRIDICANDCVAFYDCKHKKLKRYANAHRTYCPVCGADRYLRVAGLQRAVKVGFFFPLQTYMDYLFSTKELLPHLRWNAGARPSGHFKHSYGWHKKVTYTSCFLF